MIMSKHKYDQAFKDLFSHPRMIKDLLEGFIKEDFIKNIDFSCIDTVKNTFIAPKYRKRETDLIIKLKINEQEAYIFAVIEFQSKPDRFIGLRIFIYQILP
jgi:predicted transposase YdaD